MTTNNESKTGKALLSAAGDSWVTCQLGLSPSSGSPDSSQVRAKLDSFLTEILLSGNLVILAGLGTSLCLGDGNDGKLAPTMQNLWAAVAEKTGEEFVNIQSLVKYEVLKHGENIEAFLSQCQLFDALLPQNRVKDFIATAEGVIVEKCRFVDGSSNLTTHEAFLRKVARRSTRLPRTKLFTTNYDLCFETAASRSRFVVVDGFSHTQPQEFDGGYFAYDLVKRNEAREIPDYIPNVFHLYKMHGSVDWESRDGQVHRVQMPDKPLIVYPRHNKFEVSYEQPFIEMMSRFQMALRQPNTGVIVSGFGFNDSHVWQPIMSAIQSNISLKAVIIDPMLEGSEKRPIKTMEALIRAGDSRLALLAIGFEDFVPVLPDLVAGTEDEQHLKRMRKLGPSNE